MDHNIIDFRRQKRTLRQGWWFIATSFVCFTIMSIIYWERHMPEYIVDSSMLIEDNSDSGTGGISKIGGGMASMMRTFSIGGFGGSVDNEMVIAKTHDVRMRTVRNLRLNCTYIKQTDFFNREVLFNNSPINLEASDDFFATMPKGFQVKIQQHNGKVDVKVTQGFFKPTIAEFKDTQLPLTIKVPGGKIHLLKTRYYNTTAQYQLTINVSNYKAMADYLGEQLTVELTDKKSQAISLSIKDPNPTRGEAILNELMYNYNQKRIERKNEKAQESYDFYNTRIKELVTALSSAENSLASFKQRNNIANPIVESMGYSKGVQMAQSALDSARTAVKVQEMLLNVVKKSASGNDEMIPAYTHDPNIEIYNKLLIDKRELLQSAKPSNSLVVEMNEKIATARRAIIVNAEKNIAIAHAKMNSTSGELGRMQAKSSEMPGYEKQYIKLMRDQEIKNELYIFLLQKRENALLNLTSNVAPSFILDQAHSDFKPSHMKAGIVITIALLMSLILPVIFLLLLMSWRNRIQDTCDLPVEWENNAFNMHKSNYNEVRAKLLQLGKKQIIVWNTGDDNSQLLQEIAQSLNHVGKKCSVMALNHTDELYKGEVATHIAQATVQGEITLITLPAGSSIAELSDQLANDDTLLLATISGQKVKRNKWIAMVNNLKCENKVTIIS